MDGGARDGSTARAVNPIALHVFLNGIDATAVIRDAVMGGSVRNGVMGSDANRQRGVSRIGTAVTKVIQIAVEGGSAKIGDGEGVVNHNCGLNMDCHLSLAQFISLCVTF